MRREERTHPHRAPGGDQWAVVAADLNFALLNVLKNLNKLSEECNK